MSDAEPRNGMPSIALSTSAVLLMSPKFLYITAFAAKLSIASRDVRKSVPPICIAPFDAPPKIPFSCDRICIRYAQIYNYL
jgi:hypothetical protein